MTSRPQFDTGELLRGFRAACARYGIDPQEGATSFEVVRVRSERRQVSRKTRRKRRWWQRHTLWLACPSYHSAVEEEAVWNLFVETYDAEVNQLARAQRRRQAGSPSLELLTLRELHQMQAERKQG